MPFLCVLCVENAFFLCVVDRGNIDFCVCVLCVCVLCFLKQGPRAKSFGGGGIIDPNIDTETDSDSQAVSGTHAKK